MSSDSSKIWSSRSVRSSFTSPCDRCKLFCTTTSSKIRKAGGGEHQHLAVEVETPFVDGFGTGKARGVSLALRAQNCTTNLHTWWAEALTSTQVPGAQGGLLDATHVVRVSWRFGTHMGGSNCSVHRWTTNRSGVQPAASQPASDSGHNPGGVIRELTAVFGAESNQRARNKWP